MRILILAFLLVSCSEKPPSREQLERTVGFDASITAGRLVSAWRKCRIIGIKGVDQCTLLKGNLLEEVSAKEFALLAVSSRNSYVADCQKTFSYDYCKDLLERAVDIAAKKPVSTD